MKMDHEIFQDVMSHPKQHNYQPRGRGGYVNRGNRGSGGSRGGRPPTEYQNQRGGGARQPEDDSVMFDRNSKQLKE